MSDLELQLKALREELSKVLERREEPLPLLMTYDRASRVLGVGLTKLKALIRAGQIVPTKLGGRKMVPLSELQRVATPRTPVASFSGPPVAKKPRRSLRAFSAEAEAKKLKRR